MVGGIRNRTETETRDAERTEARGREPQGGMTRKGAERRTGEGFNYVQMFPDVSSYNDIKI